MSRLGTPLRVISSPLLIQSGSHFFIFDEIYIYLITQVSATRNVEYNSRKLTSNDQTIDLFEHKYRMVLFETNPLFEFFISDEIYNFVNQIY